MADKTETQSAFDAGVAKGCETVQIINGIPNIFVPPGWSYKELTHLAESPQRVEQKPEFIEAPSFIEYVKQYGNENSLIFADRERGVLIAAIDYHRIGQNIVIPDWVSHKAVLELQFTEEALTWKNQNEKSLSQKLFAEFIEDNIDDIVEPEGAELLEIVSTLQSKTKVSFTSGFRLTDGQTELQYVEEKTGTAGHKGTLKIPGEFAIGIRIFKGEAPFRMRARFRYRIYEQKLSMWYVLHRPQKVIDAAFQAVVVSVAQALPENQLLMGRP